MIQSKVFMSVPCLTERSRSFHAQDLVKKWFKGCDRRYIDRTVQDFIQINKEMLDFLAISPFVEGTGNDLILNFKTEKYIGAIPLKSPVNGIVFSDFIIYPRFISHSQDNANEYIGLVNLLKEEITPDFFDSPNLITKNQVRPPLYYECIKYIHALFDVTRSNWVRFDTRQNYYDYPKGQINWKDYINDESDPQRRIVYPCQINYLDRYHSGQRELFYVYLLAKEIIFNHSTPIKLRAGIKPKAVLLDNFFARIEPKKCYKTEINNADPVVVKNAKNLANRILQTNSTESKAWRIDFSEIFEKYIQYLFEKVSNRSSWRKFNNIRYTRLARNSPVWSLSYFEPDLVLRKNEKLISIDAKYKAHFFNLDSLSESLKEDHRYDIHQIAAYCGFQNNETKVGILCYPSSHVETRRLFYKDYFSSSGISIYLFGIPITHQNLMVVEKELEENFKKVLIDENL